MPLNVKNLRISTSVERWSGFHIVNYRREPVRPWTRPNIGCDRIGNSIRIGEQEGITYVGVHRLQHTELRCLFVGSVGVMVVVINCGMG